MFCSGVRSATAAAAAVEALTGVGLRCIPNTAAGGRIAGDASHTSTVQPLPKAYITGPILPPPSGVSSYTAFEPTCLVAPNTNTRLLHFALEVDSALATACPAVAARMSEIDSVAGDMPHLLLFLAAETGTQSESELCRAATLQPGDKAGSSTAGRGPGSARVRGVGSVRGGWRLDGLEHQYEKDRGAVVGEKRCHQQMQGTVQQQQQSGVQENLHMRQQQEEMQCGVLEQLLVSQMQQQQHPCGAQEQLQGDRDLQDPQDPHQLHGEEVGLCGSVLNTQHLPVWPQTLTPELYLMMNHKVFQAQPQQPHMLVPEQRQKFPPVSWRVLHPADIAHALHMGSTTSRVSKFCKTGQYSPTYLQHPGLPHGARTRSQRTSAKTPLSLKLHGGSNSDARERSQGGSAPFSPRIPEGSYGVRILVSMSSSL
jgi:hypothetical protein